MLAQGTDLSHTLPAELPQRMNIYLEHETVGKVIEQRGTKGGFQTPLSLDYKKSSKMEARPLLTMP